MVTITIRLKGYYYNTTSCVVYLVRDTSTHTPSDSFQDSFFGWMCPKRPSSLSQPSSCLLADYSQAGSNPPSGIEPSATPTRD